MRLLVVGVIALTLTKTIDARDTSGQSPSPYGDYDVRRMCFRRQAPVNFRIFIGSTQQPPSIKRKIQYALKKNPAVKEFLKRSSIKCNMAYVNHNGLEETCTTALQRTTVVRIGSEICYVAKPEYQCATFSTCQRSRIPCAGSLRRPMGSTCLYDGFRYFYVWAYCESCGFKLVKLNLPQCCSCRKFKLCEDVDG